MPETRKIPAHVAIIMDGNGRWATSKGLPRTAGHREGIKRVKDIIKIAAQAGVKVITLFAFSTENWSRPQREIDMLMRSLDSFLGSQIKELARNNIRFKVIGQRDPLPAYIQDKLRAAQERTENNGGMTLVLALNYGGQQEIVDAAKRFAREVKEGRCQPEDLDTAGFSNYCYTAGLPAPDLLIRTSGEMRISNFLLWQLAYTELYFSRKYWPDFKKNDFERALKAYRNRERRFGTVHTGKTNT